MQKDRNTLRWLHLSDFHTGKDQFGQSMTYGDILKHIEAVIKKGFVPDLIFLTGDIANEGKAPEYKKFMETFLRPLQAILWTTLNEDYKQRIFLIPGNHDVTRDQLQAVKFYELLQEHPTLFDVSKEGEKQRKQYLYPRFRAYNNAAMHGSTAISEKWLELSKGYYTAVFDKTLNPHHTIGVLGLNTAWLSYGKSDQHQMTPGKYLVRLGLEELARAKCDTYIVLGHHPIDWFRDEDISYIRSLFGQYKVIYLHGHLHRTSGRQDEGGGHPFLTIQSGAAFQARDDVRWVNQLLWCELDYQRKRIEVDPRQWSPDFVQWVTNTNAFPPPNQVANRSRWFLRIPRSAEELADGDDDLAEEDTLDTPPGWLHISKQFLAATNKQTVDAKQIINYYDGSFPSWPVILSAYNGTDIPNIPARTIVDTLWQRLQQIHQDNSLSVTVLLSAGGEGKTTALMQAVCRFVQHYSDWHVLWREDEKQGWSDNLARSIAQMGGTWLVVLDDTDNVAHDIYSFVKIQYNHQRNNVHFLLCCRDTDWLAINAKEYHSWKNSSDYQEVLLKGLERSDAERIFDAWEKYGKEGLRNLVNLSRTDAVQQLIEKARDIPAKYGSFLGALLQVRFGPKGLYEHVSSILSRLDKHPISDSNAYTLLDAFAYIAAIHIRDDLELPEAVLARVLGCSSNELAKYVTKPLGEEASISNKGQYLYTRHREIAKVSLSLLEERFGYKLADIYMRVVCAAVEEYNDKRTASYNKSVPNIKQWNFIAGHFYNEGEKELDESKKELAIRLAEELIKIEPGNPHFIDELSKLYRKDRQYEQAILMLRDISQKVGVDKTYNRFLSDRGYYYEWATAEGMAGNINLDAWLAGLSMADEIGDTMPDNERATMSLAGLATVFVKLFNKYNNTAFIEACAAAVCLAKPITADSRTKKILQRGYEQAKSAGIKDLAPEPAFRLLQKGIALAYTQREDGIKVWLSPDGKLHFTRLAHLLKIPLS